MRQYLFLIGVGKLQVKKVESFETMEEMRDHAIALRTHYTDEQNDYVPPVNVFPVGEMTYSTKDTDE